MKSTILKIRKLFKKTKPKGTWKALVDPQTKEWYFCDEKNHLWVCDESQDVCIDITLNDVLVAEGEVRELTRTLHSLRKLFNLKPGDPMPEFEIVN